MKRACGILLPVFSLPSEYGIGTFSREAYKFVDFLKAAGQSYWQVLPLGATGYGNSPYQSFSAFAGNPYFIDLEQLVLEGYLTREECCQYDFGMDRTAVDYEKIYSSRFKVLRAAFEKSQIEEQDAFRKFVRKNRDWLEDYALYMAVKDSRGGEKWSDWPKSLKCRKCETLEEYREKLKEDILFHKFQQYLFHVQWKKLKKYANDKGVCIIGDIPIYVAYDSADTWANQELFQLDGKGQPINVAGCPPDAFCETGQLWGNPLYRWEYHKETGYEWWIKRLAYCYELYDIVRIDHFRGFDEYYSIPCKDTTAANGRWEKGPGYDLFKAVKDRLGDKEVIAEDLGFLTPSVIDLLKKTGYPGMKILQFAFDSREEGNYFPHSYTANSVVYTGTHDNDTFRGFYGQIKRGERTFLRKYLNVKKNSDVGWEFIRAALASVSDTAVIPMQDYLGLGSEARINTPSTLGNNWVWRMTSEQMDERLADKIYQLCSLYERAE